MSLAISVNYDPSVLDVIETLNYINFKSKIQDSVLNHELANLVYIRASKARISDLRSSNFGFFRWLAGEMNDG